MCCLEKLAEALICPNIKKATYLLLVHVISDNSTLLHPSMQSASDYRSRSAQTCRVSLVKASYRSRITFPPQTNCSRGGLGLDRDHLLSKVLVRLFWSDYGVHTCPNELHQGGKRTRVQFNRTKKHRCENTLSLIYFHLFFFSFVLFHLCICFISIFF